MKSRIAALLTVIGGLAASVACGSSSSPISLSCTALTLCCASTYTTECASIASVGNASSCAAAETAYCQSFSSGTGSSSSTLSGFSSSSLSGFSSSSLSGFSSSTTSAFGTGCVALTACCPSLPVTEDPTECDAVASGGTASACELSLATYQSAGYCSTSSGSLPSCKNPPTTTSGCDACILAKCSSYVTMIEANCASYLSCIEACECSDQTCISACEPDLAGECETVAESSSTCTGSAGPCAPSCQVTAVADAG